MLRVTICAALLLCGLSAGSAPAAEISASGKFSFKPLSIKGLVLRDRVVVGPAFAEKHSIKVAAPFEFKAPRIEGILRMAKFPAQLGQAYIKIVYGTPDEKFIESIQFNPFTLDPGPLEQRQQKLAGFLKTTVWAQITDGQGDRKIDALRGKRIGEFEAVELIGRYVDVKDSANGTVLARVVGLMQPDSRHGLIATINIATGMVEVTNDAQMADTVSADILTSVAFQ